MGKIMYDDIDFSGADIIELTQADYDALPNTKYTDNITYLIKDVYSANDTRVMGIGDCYSTTERVIGCWTDGKPLYQKSFIIANIVFDSSWHHIPHGISNLDVVTSIRGMMINKTEKEMFPITAYRPTLTQGIIVGCGGTNGDSIMYMNNWYNSANTDLYITFQYTKTTDVAGSGDWTPNGVPAVHYSTDEQVIGTWIDGKTLYQKTWELTVPNSSGTYMFSETVPNLDKVYAAEYSLWGIGPRGYVPWYNSATILFSEQTSTHIEFYFASNTYAGNKIYYTSKYTKTS